MARCLARCRSSCGPAEIAGHRHYPKSGVRLHCEPSGSAASCRVAWRRRSELGATGDLVRESPRELDFAGVGNGAVVWATGYRPDLGWVGLPFLDADGYPIQRRGVTPVPGLCILGLDWLHTARSGLFAGLEDDAAYLAARIAERVRVPR